MNVLTKEEFHLLRGSELLIMMLRNRHSVTLTASEFTYICDYLEQNTTGFYHLDISGGNDQYNVMMYFETFRDRNFVEQALYTARNSAE